jgi:GalNAc-alpha-(1->4)-GalNAc-alpha-(1->3)-diNAcBac-PP-undecaprenol alpha-1,4-N-acetyl-D-galactosaminyltransferase
VILASSLSYCAERERRQMKVCCVISDLGTGGAQRVLTTICNHLVMCGHQVSLISFGAGEASFYPLAASIHRIELAATASSPTLWSAVRNNLSRLRGLRRALGLESPDVVLSFMSETNVATLLASAGLSIPVVVSERTYPPKFPIGRVRDALRRLTYPRAQTVVVQTEKGRAWAVSTLATTRIEVIPNPLSPAFAEVSEDSGVSSREQVVVALGRLDRDKCFDLLITAFGRVRHKHPDWTLTIGGHGDELKTLRALAAVEAPGRVNLAGVVAAPSELLARAGIFVLSSRFEGFPNALLEAMACGCAVISSDCDTGPRDLIRDDGEGLLVPVDDVDRMAQALDTLMSNPAQRMEMGARARAVRERFSSGAILDRWTQVLASAAQSRRGGVRHA